MSGRVPAEEISCEISLSHEISHETSDEIFDEIDVSGGGFISLSEWCEWLEAAEVAASTPVGIELAQQQHRRARPRHS